MNTETTLDVADVADRLDRRAGYFVVLFYVAFGVGLLAACAVAAATTPILGVASAVGAFLGSAPLLGIAWILDGQLLVLEAGEEA